MSIDQINKCDLEPVGAPSSRRSSVMLPVIAGLLAATGQFPKFKLPKAGKPQKKVHMRLREQIRASRQGMHNTADGRIERVRGVRVSRSWECGFLVCCQDRELRMAPINYAYGDTRAEAIRNYNDTFLHQKVKL